jgi:hypothetical protein
MSKKRIEYECNATQIHCMPPAKIVHNNFILGEEAVVISFCNMNEDPVYTSEMSKEDAVRLANLILNHYK